MGSNRLRRGPLRLHTHLVPRSLKFVCLCIVRPRNLYPDVSFQEGSRHFQGNNFFKAGCFFFLACVLFRIFFDFVYLFFSKESTTSNRGLSLSAGHLINIARSSSVSPVRLGPRFSSLMCLVSPAGIWQPCPCSIAVFNCATLEKIVHVFHMSCRLLPTCIGSFHSIFFFHMHPFPNRICSCLFFPFVVFEFFRLDFVCQFVLQFSCWPFSQLHVSSLFFALFRHFVKAETSCNQRSSTAQRYTLDVLQHPRKINNYTHYFPPLPGCGPEKRNKIQKEGPRSLFNI